MLEKEFCINNIVDSLRVFNTTGIFLMLYL